MGEAGGAAAAGTRRARRRRCGPRLFHLHRRRTGGALGGWDYDHTVFGEVLAGDAESWAAIKELESLRTSRHGAAGAVNMIDGKVTLTLAWAHPLPKTKVVFAGSRDSRE